MKVLIQRVKRAAVHVNDVIIARIEQGLLVFVGVEKGDVPDDADCLARKVGALRIFEGRTPMDLTVSDVGGACLVVSQFTLAANLAKGNRPSFEPAEAPGPAETLYLRVAAQLQMLGIPVQTGQFAADMQVELINDGPVTFWLECRAGQLKRS